KKINDATNHISGRVFEDTDGDTIYTAIDNPVLMDSIYLQPFNLYLVSDSLGLWQATIDTGIFDLNNIIPLGYSQIKPVPNNYSLNIPLTNQIIPDLDFVLVIQTGIMENQSESNFQIYPNPFRCSILIKGTKEKGEVVLCDMMGKEILRQKSFDGETKVKTENISKGFYLLHYSDENSGAKFKMVKQ
ncbi:MAG TPA: T9SS type A sorting domain-containing protein, partial [Bacteroidia bacterium]|nr:T9SS type A sorting domain-containing protein [Bacteroidia bacterium]